MSALSHYTKTIEAMLSSLLNHKCTLEILFGRATHVSRKPSLLSDWHPTPPIYQTGAQTHTHIPTKHKCTGASLIYAYAHTDSRAHTYTLVCKHDSRFSFEGMSLPLCVFSCDEVRQQPKLMDINISLQQTFLPILNLHPYFKVWAQNPH